MNNNNLIYLSVTDFFSVLKEGIVTISDFICGYPLFFWLIGGGLFLFIYSGAIPLRRLNWSLKALRTKSPTGEGQISSFQALMSSICSTVGMGNIAGVAIAISIGGPGAIFWMWVSALLGMATKFFEGTLAIMYKGKDKEGNVHGGPMYMLTEGLGKKFRPMAIFFAFFGMIGTLCFMQANQLTESFITVLDAPDTFNFRLITGIIMVLGVSIVVLGGIKRISKIATKVVPIMVGSYFLLVFIIIVINIELLPKVFHNIVSEAFNIQAGFGALAFIALTGARRAMYVNEAGVGTASLMHGASRNAEPVGEGLIAMIGPAIDSGLVCTLTAIPILMAMMISPIEVEGVKGLYIALNAFETMLPGWGEYALMVIVFIFAVTTMFSYSYYGTQCAGYLFGYKNGKYYDYFYLLMIVVACVISLDLVVSIMDLAFAFMAIPTMYVLLRLAPQVKREAKVYFSKNKLED